MIPIITVFISGLFGLIVALATLQLSSKREKTKHEQELSYQDYKRLEDFFIRCLSNLNKVIRITKSGIDYTELYDELSRINAESILIADETINKKLYVVNEIMYNWSAAYREGLPKRLGDTDFALVSNCDVNKLVKANKIFIDLSREITELSEIMKTQLFDLRKKL